MMPAIARFKTRGLILRAQEEINSILCAIHSYEETYGRLPVSTETRNAVMGLAEDYTYGNTFVRQDGKRVVIGGPGTYLNNNNEVMAMLMDMEVYPNGQHTLNQDHVRNPKRIKFLTPRLGRTTDDPGLGPDGAYRDPWGVCYMITLDLNNDGRARDFFYRNPAVSEEPAHGMGLPGMTKSIDINRNVVFEVSAPVVVWSAGPDRMVNPEKPATEEVNRDNVISWNH
jgi:hypothetical protein